MCGIFGYFGNKPRGINTEEILDSLHHRGPDDHGSISIGNGVLAHTRLSIIDLSESGRQPMCNNDQTLWVTSNGEIYNYIELKAELPEYNFKTATDTEVILAAYEKWGEGFLGKLRGMFAFGLLDTRENKLICAVDRFGIKPCYYSVWEDGFFFSSEVKTLQSAGVPLKPDNDTIYDYLVYGLLNHNDRTFFADIRLLRPGHFLVYKDDKIAIKMYWDLDEKQGWITSTDNMIESIEESLRESVRIHLRSDVEYGLSLSSGLDSNLLRCMVAEVGGLKNPLKCFSFCFIDTEYNECADLSRTDTSGVSYYKTNVTSESLLKDFPKIVSVQEGPIGGAGVYAFWMNMKLARDTGIKVIINGQGADELFCGYKYYYEIWMSELYQNGDYDRVEKELAFFNGLHDTNYTLDSQEFQNIVHSNKRDLIRASDGTYLDGHGYLSDDFFLSKQPDQLPGTYNFSSPTKNRIYNDLRYLKIPKLLQFQDKTAMCWGVEVRVPFLDHVLFEKIFPVPTEHMLQNGLTKYLLRKIAEKYEDPITRQFHKTIKKYMPTPQREWLKYELVEPIKELIDSSILHERGYIDKTRLLRVYDNYTKDEDLGNSYFIWKFLNLEYLFNVFTI